MLRAALDTNVWLRGVLREHSAAGRVIEAFVQGIYTLVTSEPLLDEVADVLQRPELRRKFPRLTPENVARALSLQRRLGVLVDIPGTLQLCRDPDDDKVIETALVGQATFIVTYDNDLLNLTVPGVTIVTPEQFLQLLGI